MTAPGTAFQCRDGAEVMAAAAATPVGDGGADRVFGPPGSKVTSVLGGTVSDRVIVPQRVDRKVYVPGSSSVTTWPLPSVSRLPTQLPVEP